MKADYIFSFAQWHWDVCLKVVPSLLPNACPAGECEDASASRR